MPNDWNAAAAAKEMLQFVHKISRSYGLDRVYNSCKDCVHFDGWGGGFTIGFEEDKEGVYSEVSISGESNSKIDDIFLKHFNNIVFDDQNDLKQEVDKCFRAALDMAHELYPDEVED